MSIFEAIKYSCNLNSTKHLFFQINGGLMRKGLKPLIFVMFLLSIIFIDHGEVFADACFINVTFQSNSYELSDTDCDALPDICF
jgi:hypothetical protein